MKGAPTLDDVRRALAGNAMPGRRDVAAREQAAVAAVLRQGAGGLELLFIRRAEHPRDPWSGHMGWPGGRLHPDDPSPLAAAVRETLEELDLDLDREAELLGALPEVRTHLRRPGVPHWVAPFVFALRGDPTFTLNQEIVEALWVPFAFLLDRGNRGRFVWTGRGIPLLLPCYRFEGRIIWGLTLRMLDDLVAALGSAE
jgi:8-oxo-dGTP pyrophosphatase MutT (NUDIX family)